LILVDHNLLSGPIPASFGANKSLSKLIYFYADTNFLSQTIPATFGNLERAADLLLNTNVLSGGLPAGIGQMTSLHYLMIYENMLSQSLDSCLFACLPNLIALELDNNRFSGPVIFSESTINAQLSVIDLSINQFTGSLSSSISAMKSLNSFFVGTNSITGLVPSSVYSLSGLVNLDLNHNYFTGTLSPAFSTSLILTQFSVGRNFFTGFLADTFLSQLADLEDLDISENYLEGYLPADIATNCHHLESLNVGFNFLTGTVNDLFVGILPRLALLNISGNSFSGDINAILDVDVSAYISFILVLDFSDNQISGSFPETFWSKMPFLESLLLYSNCLSSSLPSTVCSMKNLTTLVLDAASSSTRCDVQFPGALDFVFNRATVSKQSLSGTIPSCIWSSMPALQTLHLSSNGLVGTLDDLGANTSSAKQLQFVSLSNNKLVGSIPSSWQQYGGFQFLDLSSNKLSGTLSNDFVLQGTDDENGAAVSAAVNLTINRLSGSVPSTFTDAPNINVLNGNLFDCNKHTEPVHDPSVHQYVCGSTSFNNALALLAGCLGICLLVAVVLRWWFHRSFLAQFFAAPVERNGGAKVSSRQSDAKTSGGPFTRYINWVQITVPQLHESFTTENCTTNGLVCFVRELTSLHGYLHICGLPVFFLCGIAYAALKGNQSMLSAYYSTHTYQYTWVLSVAFMHGWLPVCVSGLAVGSGLVAAVRWLAVKDEAYSHSDNESKYCSSRACGTWSRNCCILPVLLCIHCAVVLIVNIAYVYALFKGLPTAQLFFLQLGLSLFKLLWNEGYETWVLKRVVVSGSSITQEQADSHLVCLCFMIFFTFLASPVLATIFTDPQCFRYLFTGQSSVVSTFTSPDYGCELFCTNEQCKEVCAVVADAEPTTATVNPVWNYSYQCSSSILVNYAPVLLMALIISGLIMPVLSLLFVFVMEQEGVRQILRRRLPGLYIHILGSKGNHRLMAFTVAPEPVSSSKLADTTQILTDDKARSDARISSSRRRRAYDNVSVLGKAFLDLAILLTFGVACPLICIAVIINSYSHLSLLVMMANRFVGVLQSTGTTAAAAANLVDTSTVLNSHRNGVQSVLGMIVLVVVPLFWTLFVFDMIGDVYGARDGALSLICPLGGCLLLYIRMQWRRLSTIGEMLSRRRIADVTNEQTGAVLAGADHNISSTSKSTSVAHEDQYIERVSEVELNSKY
jgi:Leucine-rich repeat (LRR) protein